MSSSMASWVDGFRLMQKGMSSWPVCTPNGMQGSTATLAPASQARRPASAQRASFCRVSVP